MATDVKEVITQYVFVVYLLKVDFEVVGFRDLLGIQNVFVRDAWGCLLKMLEIESVAESNEIE